MSHDILRHPVRPSVSERFLPLLAQVGGNCGMVFIMVTMPLAMSEYGFGYPVGASL